MLDDLATLFLGEWLQVEQRAELGPVRSLLEQFRPGGTEQEDGCRRRVPNVLDQVEEGRFRPVNIFEDDDKRPPARLELEQLPRSPEDLVEWEVSAGQPDRGGNARYGIFTVLSGDLEHLGAPDLGRIFVTNPGGVANDLDEGPERDAATVRQAPPAKDAGLSLRGLHELFEQSRLADAGLCDNGDQPARSVARSRTQLVTEDAELPGAPDQRTVVPSLDALRSPDGDE